MPSDAGASESSQPRIADPVALAQGHRLLKAADAIELPVWTLGAVTLVMLGIIGLLNEVAWIREIGAHESRLGAVLLLSGLALAVLWLFARPERPIEAPAPARLGPRLPGGVEDLLALIDGLILQLERGEDRAFDLDATGLGLALDRLSAAELSFLEVRGVDGSCLRTIACSTDGEVVERLPPDRRRALHHELVRFAAAVRGRACGDPYRSRFGGVPGLLATIRDPALAQTRRALAVTVAVIVIAWLAGWSSIAALRSGYPLEFCNPLVRAGPCHLAIDADEVPYVFVVALAAVPTFLPFAAWIARAAAWRSFAAALPELAHERRPRPLLRRALVVMVAPICGCPALLYASLVFDWVEAPVAGVVVLLELLGLGLVATRPLADALLRRLELRRFRRREARAGARGALIRELVAYRFELCDAAPPRREQLEQLARVLADATELGRLGHERRDGVVARLRAAANRGPALDRRHREGLVGELVRCERWIAREAG